MRTERQGRSQRQRKDGNRPHKPGAEGGGTHRLARRPALCYHRALPAPSQNLYQRSVRTFSIQ
eukprot:4875136-Prymnesium_polylepis.1